jgi:hypothetical protein
VLSTTSCLGGRPRDNLARSHNDVIYANMLFSIDATRKQGTLHEAFYAFQSPFHTASSYSC